MFDWVYWGNVELTTPTLLFSLLILLPVQLLLCFKVRSRKLRLLPVGVLSILVVALLAVAALATGWDKMFYYFFAIYAGIMLFVCGIGWGIWTLVILWKKLQQKE